MKVLAVWRAGEEHGTEGVWQLETTDPVSTERR